MIMLQTLKTLTLIPARMASVRLPNKPLADICGKPMIVHGAYRAVAAKLVHPDKKVLAISGDGGFMMNSQEYETALREGTPIVTLIFSDASYGLIKWKQMDHFGHNCFVDFQNPDFVKYADKS